ncbi:D-glucuronate isomerase [Pelagirhabdus alkalitolerans]|uniref:Uronate isomerase n=1 Tax=Pelagirhabdus alkalitolerans TaxID=1612202 RepID=A0A1G6JT17_9BACI|nr:glucuronate isomerase [Pelagirhabdus alkalitolerans]SDC21575.1 D-glucuronate isomerase [Pelagirhabdus alkalitolerans]
MSKPFIHDQFLLQSETSEWLYHDYAKDLPIIDYHCHLSPKEIADNELFESITDIWLSGDHYKWRAMRAFGVDEAYITGNASKEEKFMKWAEVVPKTLGNPLYHWTHLELSRYFGIDELLSPDTAKDIWQETNRLLQTHAFRPKSIIKRSNVEAICTTDAPVDTLSHHREIEKDTQFDTKVLPTLRPDTLLQYDMDSFYENLRAIEIYYDQEVSDEKTMKVLLRKMVNFFHESGCRLADFGMQRLNFEPVHTSQFDQIMVKIKKQIPLSFVEKTQYQTAVIIEFAHLFHEYDWVMQLHIGAIRDNNTRMYHQAGKDSGFDSIDDFLIAKPLNQLLDAIDQTDQLPQTIIYNLNPNHNEVIATTIGNFQTGNRIGKVQFGSGWWFNDQKRGMERQINDLAHFSYLQTFVGMLTDSRSFLSYTRHEYFRRILANIVGEWVEEGLVPNDKQMLGQLMTDICYQNAKNYFAF